jgi:hypothetical protein
MRTFVRSKVDKEVMLKYTLEECSESVWAWLN